MIDVSIDEGVATLRINRPADKNAMSFGDLEELHSALDGISSDPAVKVVVITGTGDAFSAGADFRAYDADNLMPYAERGLGEIVPSFARALRACPVPVIAAVNGLCFGGGVGIALMADVTVAKRSAYFVSPQVQKLGFNPDLGSSLLLTRNIGRARAMGMALLAERISAEQAAEWGLIWACVDDADFDAEIARVAALLARDPEAVVATRRLVDSSAAATLNDQLLAECDSILTLLARPHMAAMLTALVAKR